MTYLIVFFGGGSAPRCATASTASARFRTAFPYATMIENVSGSL